MNRNKKQYIWWKNSLATAIKAMPLLVVLAIIGFVIYINQPASEEDAVKTIWSVASPLLITFASIGAFASIVWVIMQWIKGGKKDGGLASGTKNVLKKSGGIVFSLITWLIFVATIHFLHSDLWHVWWDNQPLFWISQGVFLTLSVAFQLQNRESLFNLLIILAVSVSLSIGFKDELIGKGLIAKKSETTSSSLKKTKWKLCRDNRKGVRTCRPRGVTIFVKIQEYHDGIFTFTASWKERGVLKKRALFRWDRIANPNYGMWHQLGSSRSDEGRWRLEALGKDGIFHGWQTAKNGRKYSMSLEPI